MTMKKIWFIALFWGAFFAGVSAQEAPFKALPKEKEKPVYIRDRFMFDFFHSFWMGVPEGVDVQKFHPGFNFSALWDFKLPNNSPISFGLGLGFTYITQFSDAGLTKDSLGLTQYAPLGDVKYKLNRVTFTNVNIPFEIRYRHSSGFKISLGARVGLITGITHRYHGPNPLNKEEDLNWRNYNIGNKEQFCFDVYLRTGWKMIGVFYSYQVTKLFKTDKGPSINPMSLGLTINFF